MELGSGAAQCHSPALTDETSALSHVETLKGATRDSKALRGGGDGAIGVKIMGGAEKLLGRLMGDLIGELMVRL